MDKLRRKTSDFEIGIIVPLFQPNADSFAAGMVPEKCYRRPDHVLLCPALIDKPKKPGCCFVLLLRFLTLGDVLYRPNDGNEIALVVIFAAEGGVVISDTFVRAKKPL